MFYISLLVVALYALVLLYGEARWLFRGRKLSDRLSEKSLSLIVACRDEAERLPALLSSIEPQMRYIDQLVFASDNSTDGTFMVLQSFAKKHGEKVVVFETRGEGKKNALSEAVAKAEGEYLVFTDGDCVLNPSYFRELRRLLATRAGCDLAVGSVRYAVGGSLFGRLQTLEFASLQASTAYTLAGGFPIMCNGANLVCRRDLWLLAQSHLHSEQPSGDDIFLLHFAKKQNKNIVYFSSSKSIVETYPEPTLKGFLEQRKRWASKSGSYRDLPTIIVACLVLLANLLVAASLCLCPFLPKMLWVFAIKFAADTAILLPFLAYSRQLRLGVYILPLSVVYPFYIVYAAAGGLLGSFRWK